MVVEPAGSDLESVLYVAAYDGKRVRPGMTVQLSPSTVKREECGFLVARVREVHEYATQRSAMLSQLDNPELVDAILAAVQVPLRVVADLEPAATPSGYRWSSSRGPETRITPGTPCTASIVVEEQPPISLVLPVLKKKFGLD